MIVIWIWYQELKKRINNKATIRFVTFRRRKKDKRRGEYWYIIYRIKVRDGVIDEYSAVLLMRERTKKAK